MLAKNSYGLHTKMQYLEISAEGSADASLPGDFGVKSSVSIDKATGTVTIADADVVVSAGTWIKRT